MKLQKVPHNYYKIIFFSGILLLLIIITMMTNVETANAKSDKTTRIKQLSFYMVKNNKYNAKLKWNSDKGMYYQILRKKGSKKYVILKTVKAKSRTTVFRDKNLAYKHYRYIVRKVQKNISDNYTIKGKYDKKGVKTVLGPKIKKLQYYKYKKSYYAKLTFTSQKGKKYLILRKKKNSKKYKSIHKVTAKSSQTTYKNKKIGKNKEYTYSVRRIDKYKNNRIVYSAYDLEGISTIKMPSLKVDFSNLEAKISWNIVSGADDYIVYRKTADDSKFTKVIKVQGTKNSYTDVYGKSTDNPTISKRITATYFIDPSKNDLIYTIRPYHTSSFQGVKKESYGLYLKDGISHLETPTIVSLSPENGELTWGTVPNADGYFVFSKDSSTSNFENIRTVLSKKSLYQSTHVNYSKEKYYTVQAYNKRNDVTNYSGYDHQFTHKDKEFDERVLFLGDSITFGSPYYYKERDNFSYPHRIKELTGIDIFNPSIPGSTYHYDPDISRYRIVNGVASRIAKGENTDDAFGKLQILENTSTFEDYDVVLMAAGTNDYFDRTQTKFGSRETDWEKIDDSQKTLDLSFTVNRDSDEFRTTYQESYDYDITTFDGAYNQIMKYIEEASLKRVLNNKSPIKVITVDLFYSNRTSPFNKLTNRDITPNKLGKTLKDYQNELTYLNSIWAKSPVLDFFNYKTRSKNIVNSSNCDVMSTDNLHFTKYAYSLYGNSIADFMIKEVLPAESKQPQEDKIEELKLKYGIE